MSESASNVPQNLVEANEAITKIFNRFRGLILYSEHELREQLATAYDDGFTACAEQHMKQAKDEGHPITRENPYRA